MGFASRGIKHLNVGNEADFVQRTHRNQWKAVSRQIEKSQDSFISLFLLPTCMETTMNSSVKVLRRAIDPAGRISVRIRKADLSSEDGLLTFIVSGWIIGTWAGLYVPFDTRLAASTCAVTLGIVMVFGRKQRRSLQVWIIVLGFALLGALRSSIDSSGSLVEHQAIHDIADGRIIKLSGRVSSIDENVTPRTGLVERFGYNPSAHVLEVREAVVHDGSEFGISIDSVMIRVASSGESTTGLRIGDKISLRGTLHGGRRATNPGMKMPRSVDPWIKVPHQELISITKREVEHDNGNQFWFKSWREWVVETLDDFHGGMGKRGKSVTGSRNGHWRSDGRFR